MEEYFKIKKIQKLSNLIGCLKRFPSGKIELFLIAIEIIILILCIMNVLIIPFQELKMKPLYGLRIVVISFSSISLIISIFNKIFRKKNKLTGGYFYCIAFFGSLGSIGLNCLNFLFIFIALIITQTKFKNYKGNKSYDSNSILALDIISLIILIILFFFWYAEVFLVYSKIKNDQSLKELIESKIAFYQSQNAKIVNIEMGGKFPQNIEQKDKNSNTSSNVEYEDIMSTNKMDVNEDKQSEQSEQSKDDKDDNISNKEENNITNDIGK